MMVDSRRLSLLCTTDSIRMVGGVFDVIYALRHLLLRNLVE